MPKGPKGQKRPADVIGNAVHVMRIATGEIEEKPKEAKTTVRSSAGKKGAAARAATLTPSKRTEIARKAAKTRWSEQGKSKVP
jgi:hypothetical protein